MNYSKILFCAVILAASFFLKSEVVDSLNTRLPQVTFLEHGSTTCMPCKMMEKVLEEIEEIYGDSVAVKFIDVTKNRQEAIKDNIKLIPTQIFLDADGIEIFRHQGYFLTKEIQKVIDLYLRN